MTSSTLTPDDIKLLRQAAGLPAEAAAIRAGLAGNAISRYESGAVKTMKPSNLRAIVTALDTLARERAIALTDLLARTAALLESEQPTL